MSELSRYKRQRENNEARDEEDASMKILNNLPDVVLVDIISRLEMKEAIRTSVVSKRWEYLWASKYDLAFNDEDCKHVRYFRSIVDRALMLRDSSSINEFCLSCEVECHDDSRIKTWICDAVKKNVCVANFTLDGVFVLPSCLLTCATLTSLSLSLLSDFSIPTPIGLPALKCLIFNSVEFSADNSIQKLLSSCPVLEKLCFGGCIWTNLSSLSISVPVLKSLEIFDSKLIPSFSDCDGCQFAIFATSHFESFIYYEGLENECIIFNSPSIVDACIHVNYNDGRRREVADKAYKLLNGLANVEKLVFVNDVVKALSAAEAEQLLPHFPMFQRLAHLQLKIPSVNLDCKPLLKLLCHDPFS
ncbi:putative F-box protein At3g58860 [Mercurialis annua]|uniref:putative F-box protein At3g58860 n=1 Tax=Mercurialis annua TaxID=3986 RepID=UPI0024AFB48C|nr:putative F-box protein At3g58860 [Mercurialis annua]